MINIQLQRAKSAKAEHYDDHDFSTVKVEDGCGATVSIFFNGDCHGDRANSVAAALTAALAAIPGVEAL